MTIKLQLAKKLLEWNKINLTCHSTINKRELSEFFADNFLVKANGRVHDANYDNYYQFLNEFKREIVEIDYDIEEFLQTQESIIIPLAAHIKRPDGNVQHFTAMLLLKFNKENKIILWQEVYVESE